MNLEAFEAMANSNHRFGAFEETVSALLFVLHPMPYTLYPIPYTLYSIPYTLHPTPYTLHPTPHTPRPTPHTGIQGKGGATLEGFTRAAISPGLSTLEQYSVLPKLNPKP